MTRSSSPRPAIDLPGTNGLAVATLLALILLWLPVPMFLHAIAGAFVVLFAPGVLLLRFFLRGRTLDLVERAALAAVLSLSIPYVMIFALFFWIRFDSPSLRFFLTLFLLIETIVLLAVTMWRARGIIIARHRETTLPFRRAR